MNRGGVEVKSTLVSKMSVVKEGQGGREKRRKKKAHFDLSDRFKKGGGLEESQGKRQVLI